MTIFHETPDGITFNVKVIPRAKRDGIAGIEGDALKIRLVAPPVQGRANEALIKFLAAALDIPPRQVQLLRGETSRHKVVRVHGITLTTLREKLSS